MSDIELYEIVDKLRGEILSLAKKQLGATTVAWEGLPITIKPIISSSRGKILLFDERFGARELDLWAIPWDAHWDLTDQVLLPRKMHGMRSTTMDVLRNKVILAAEAEHWDSVYIFEFFEILSHDNDGVRGAKCLCTYCAPDEEEPDVDVMPTELYILIP